MKLRKFFVALFFAIMLMTVQVMAVDAAEKIGFVDLSRLFDEYHVTKEYDKVLEGKHKVFQEEAQKKMEEIREAQGRLALLKDDQKASLEEEIKQMQTDLLEFDRQEKLNLNNERQEKIREILLEIEKIVSSYAEKEGYSIILNDRVLIFGIQDMNLTEQILEILNEQ